VAARLRSQVRLFAFIGHHLDPTEKTHAVINITASMQLRSYSCICRIGTAYTVLTFDIAPNSAPLNTGLSLRCFTSA
jgi:hypothetical protein